MSVGLDPSHNLKSSNGPQKSAAPVNLVPQITQPLKTDKQIVAVDPKPASHWKQVEAIAVDYVKSYSSPGNAEQAYGREALNKGVKKAQEGVQHAESFLTVYWNWVLCSWLGYPFRHSLQRTASLVVLGAPYSRLSLICNAITALTNLASFSLKQDELGRFHEGVPQIIRIFTTAIQKLDEYMTKAEIHWSDSETLKKPEADRRKVSQVDEVRECLREGLERILGSFNEFLGGMGLSKLEILDAKKAIGLPRGPEVFQASAARC